MQIKERRIRAVRGSEWIPSQRLYIAICRRKAKAGRIRAQYATFGTSLAR